MSRAGTCLLALALGLAAATVARAEWTEDAQYCAAGMEVTAVLDACNRAIAGGRLTDVERMHTLNNRAWALMELDRVAEARADAEASIALDANGGQAMAWNSLGRTWLLESHWRNAEAAFLRALSRLAAQAEEEVITVGAGTAVDATANLVLVYDGMNDARRTEEWTRRAHALAPDLDSMQEYYRRYGLP
jgi:tetratricopeptide (TPR) repeat protein